MDYSEFHFFYLRGFVSYQSAKNFYVICEGGLNIFCVDFLLIEAQKTGQNISIFTTFCANKFFFIFLFYH